MMNQSQSTQQQRWGGQNKSPLTLGVRVVRYGRWKREAKRLQAEYRRLQQRPVRARAFRPPTYSEGDDATPYLQHALDHMMIGSGGVLMIEPGRYVMTRQLRLEDARLDGLRLPLPPPSLLIQNCWFDAPQQPMSEESGE